MLKGSRMKYLSCCSADLFFAGKWLDRVRAGGAGRIGVLDEEGLLAELVSQFIILNLREMNLTGGKR
jgi:hypothetical protein